jgi:hypothetical protein
MNKLRLKKLHTPSGQFENALVPDGCSMVISNEAFSAGSSKHGLMKFNYNYNKKNNFVFNNNYNALLASNGSNLVVTILLYNLININSTKTNIIEEQVFFIKIITIYINR